MYIMLIEYWLVFVPHLANHGIKLLINWHQLMASL